MTNNPNNNLLSEITIFSLNNVCSELINSGNNMAVINFLNLNTNQGFEGYGNTSYEGNGVFKLRVPSRTGTKDPLYNYSQRLKFITSTQTIESKISCESTIELARAALTHKVEIFLELLDAGGNPTSPPSLIKIRSSTSKFVSRSNINRIVLDFVRPNQVLYEKFRFVAKIPKPTKNIIVERRFKFNIILCAKGEKFPKNVTQVNRRTT